MHDLHLPCYKLINGTLFANLLTDALVLHPEAQSVFCDSALSRREMCYPLPELGELGKFFNLFEEECPKITGPWMRFGVISSDAGRYLCAFSGGRLDALECAISMR